MPARERVRERVPARVRVRLAALDPARRERADVLPPRRPPLRDGDSSRARPRPEPDFLPPPEMLFTVAHARLSASYPETPRLL